MRGFAAIEGDHEKLVALRNLVAKELADATYKKRATPWGKARQALVEHFDRQLADLAREKVELAVFLAEGGHMPCCS